MRSKGIVLEIDKIGAVVINNQGNYIRIKSNDKLIPGVLVEYTENDVINKKQTPFFRILRENSKIVYTVGSAAVFIFIIAIFAILSRQALSSTFAYIDVDINPSVELKINKSSNIVGVKSLNEDGEKLCQSIDFIGKKAENGIMEIINRSQELGYLQDKTKLVLVAGALQVDGKITSEKYDKLNKEMEGLIENIKDKIRHENKEVQLVAFHTSPIKIKEAHDKNMSLGRYSLYDNAENQGIKLALEDAKNLKISELFNLLPTKDFSNFEEEQKLDAVDKEEIKEIIKDDKDISKDKQQDEDIASSKTGSTSKSSKGNNKNMITKEPGTKSTHSSNSLITVTPATNRNEINEKNSEKNNEMNNEMNSENNDKKNDEDKPYSTPVNRGKSDVTAIAQIQTPTPIISRPSENKTESKEPQNKNNNENSDKSNNGNGNSNKDSSTKNNNKHTPEPVASTPVPAVSAATPITTPVNDAGNSSSLPSATVPQIPSAVISTPVPTASNGKNNNGQNETAPGQVKKNSNSNSKGQGNKNGKN